MLIAGQNTFEVLPAQGDGFFVFVNREPITKHDCQIKADEHCERLRLQDIRDQQARYLQNGR